ncbi:MAG TPA: hypothetical protein VLV15_06135, partial [Dongiaceae bacterium]|nr:hypothetical protein [Dongiaceae bacterium]
MTRTFWVRGLVGLCGLVVVLAVVPASFAAALSALAWPDAFEVPGTAALNAGGDARVVSVSCAAVGECAAVGRYNDGSGTQAFVVDETSGVWGDAVEVPGTAALNSGGDARVVSVSCGAVGECAAVGRYKDGSGNFHVFVVDETSGVWGDAVEVPGTAALNSGGSASVDSVSCGAVGECAAGGSYMDDLGAGHAFVVSEKSGVWGNAVEVPGTAALNTGGVAELVSVACS